MALVLSYKIVLSTTSKLLSSDHNETKHSPPPQRCRTNGGDDRLSNLPDEILCHILSFLPTKNAVATSILSSRYSSLWSYIPVLDFPYQRHLHSPQKFMEFVNKVLAGNRSPSINTFKLSFENCTNSKTNHSVHTQKSSSSTTPHFSAAFHQTIPLPI
ncbi:hypothetical protein RJ640_003885 [Escallonia rubra]|uniref:F-box domain-containing protein n=1 Tax=Escallonia rubra TaxID=112253 RepID=A0AA88QVG4_9ASTE|nr:hypothetical protein RJ640_003885 [Escallonia rubra]